MGTYNARFYEGRYLAGIVAGRMTKTNVAGYVGAFPIPEVVMGINAFTRGMRSVNPEGPGEGRLGQLVVRSGPRSAKRRTRWSRRARTCSRITRTRRRSVQAAEAKKVYAVAYHSDMSKYGPNAQITAVTHVWDKYYTSARRPSLDGTWKPDNVWGGIKEGMIKMGPFGKAVPKDVQDLMKKAEADIAAGRLHPFTGPMKDNDGKERLAAGKMMTDDVLTKMDYYVEGVQGKIPASK